MTPDATKQPVGGHAPVDADAVCEVCNTVNTDGTLLCHNCGNNLRDQKLRRLQQEIPADVSDGPSIQNIVRGIVGVVGLLAVLIVAFASDDIAGAYVGGGGEAADYSRLFSAPGAADFATLEQAAGSVLASNELVASALANPPAPGYVDGIYVITSAPDGVVPPQVLGTGAAMDDGSRILFLAKLNGNIEIRGVAYRQGSRAFLSDWDQVAVRMPNGDIVGATGAAVTQQDGSLECNGLYDLDEFSYDAVAYQIPQ